MWSNLKHKFRFLSDIEKSILEQENLITNIRRDKSRSSKMMNGLLYDEVEDALIVAEGELSRLKTERLHILDRRDSWKNKIIWSIIAPILVALITTIMTTYVLTKFDLIIK